MHASRMCLQFCNRGDQIDVFVSGSMSQLPCFDKERLQTGFCTHPSQVAPALHSFTRQVMMINDVNDDHYVDHDDNYGFQDGYIGTAHPTAIRK